MSQIGFNNSSQSFLNLVQTAKNLTQSDQQLSTIDKKQLLDLAQADGETTQEELSFIDLVANPENISTMSDESFNASSFTFNMEYLPEELNTSQSNLENKPTQMPMTATRRADSQELTSPFDKVGTIQDPSLNLAAAFDNNTEEQLVTTIRQDPILTNNPALTTSVDVFLRSLETNGIPDKECCVYLKELLNRQPPISPSNLITCLNRLSTMVNTEYVNYSQSESKGSRENISSLELVRSGLHDIAVPSDIGQYGTNTCSGTTIQSQLAIRNPVEYLSMLDNLAQNRPYTTLGINGSDGGVSINPNWRFNQSGNSEERTISSRIMQGAIMDYTNGATVQDTTGNISRPRVSNLGTLAGRDGGRLPVQNVELMENLFDQDLTTTNPIMTGLSALSLATNRGAYRELERNNPSPSNPIAVSMKYGGGMGSLHFVNVVGINNIDNTVEILNPHGRRETIPQDIFRRSLVSSTVPQR